MNEFELNATHDPKRPAGLSRPPIGNSVRDTLGAMRTRLGRGLRAVLPDDVGRRFLEALGVGLLFVAIPIVGSRIGVPEALYSTLPVAVLLGYFGYCFYRS